jgi:hypothetical protein
MDICVVSKDKKTKCRTVKTQTQVQMKYKESTREQKKISVRAIFFAPVHTDPDYGVFFKKIK